MAAHTTFYAWVIRAVADPFSVLAQFLVVDSGLVPVIAWRRWKDLPVGRLVPLAKPAIIGALVAFGAFGSSLIAARIDHAGEVAALCETSVVFAALIGALILGEKVGVLRGGLMGLIGFGALMMEAGGGA